MPAYLVAADPGDPVHRVNGVDMAVVFAADEDDAKSMAKSKFAGDGNASWEAATVTELTAAADMEDWRLRVRVAPPGGGDNLYDVTVVGGASDGIDELGTAMETALDALGLTATYDGTLQVLTVATGAGADDLGDHTLVVEFLPPSADFAEAVAVPGFVSSITHEGVSTADLDATFAADAYDVPALYAVGKQS